jgi:CheY-like chemotaxis protein
VNKFFLGRLQSLCERCHNHDKQRVEVRGYSDDIDEDGYPTDPRARPNVPVIMITAYGDEATRKKAAELGAAGLLTKPIDFGLLRQEIDQRLERTV